MALFLGNITDVCLLKRLNQCDLIIAYENFNCNF